MFQKTLCAVAFSTISFVTQAVETLDVLVVFDQNTINGYSHLNTTTERNFFANSIIDDMNTTFSNSELGDVLQFRLDGNVTTPYSAYKSGRRETVSESISRYKGFFNNNQSNNGTVKGTLYSLQKQYKADAVIGVMKPGIDPNDTTNSITCGKAIAIPNKTMSSSHNSLNQIGGFGLYMIDPNDHCLSLETTAAHEFAHTAGIYHGAATDTTTKYNQYKPNMLVTGAAGYYNSSLKFQTAMSYKDIYMQL